MGSLHSDAARTRLRRSWRAKGIVSSFLAFPVLALSVLLLIAPAGPASAQPVITSAPPPNGTLGVPYSYTVKATGMFVSFSASVNSLPPGLTIASSTGVISGTPTVAGTFTGLIVAYSPFYPNSPATQFFNIVIAASGRGQVITFAPLIDRALSNLGYGLIATATSGLPVSFASLTSATCFASGNFVYLLAVGTCTIRASQAGNANYDPAPNVDQSFNITPALLNQTITFAALSNQPLGAPPFTLSAAASSGLVVAFASLTTTVCTVSGTSVTLATSGTCTIRASQAGNATYAPAPNVDQSFVVTGTTNQTITFGPLNNKPLGSPPFTVSATASSGLVITFSSLTTAACGASGSTITLVAVGTCTIRASQSGNAIYAPAPNVDQSFAVTPALINQSIVFAPIGSKALGLPPFTISAAASSGLPVSFASLTTSICAVNSTDVTLVALGTCTIRASQAGNATYAAAPNVDQSFIVIAPVTQYIYDGAGNVIRIQRNTSP